MFGRRWQETKLLNYWMTGNHRAWARVTYKPVISCDYSETIKKITVYAGTLRKKTPREITRDIDGVDEQKSRAATTDSSADDRPTGLDKHYVAKYEVAARLDAQWWTQQHFGFSGYQHVSFSVAHLNASTGRKTILMHMQFPLEFPASPRVSVSVLLSLYTARFPVTAVTKSSFQCDTQEMQRCMFICIHLEHYVCSHTYTFDRIHATWSAPTAILLQQLTGRRHAQGQSWTNHCHDFSYFTPRKMSTTTSSWATMKIQLFIESI
jgi:hypothetical protein